MTWSCSVAAMFALLGFLIACLAAYRALITARDMERWRNMQDHPSRGVPPEDRPEWGQE